MLLITAVLAVGATAGQITVRNMETYDTGIRYATGRWRIGAAVDMRYLNYFGNPASTDWETNLWINSIHDGGLLAGTGPQYFTAPAWISSTEGMANFDTCYQGKSYALVPDDAQQVGGNRLCTDPRPVVETPSCDDDCKSPLLLSLRGDYRLTSAHDGVQFDIDGDGISEQVAWTARDSDLAFIALDRNGNARIDSGTELFGDSTLLATGETRQTALSLWRNSMRMATAPSTRRIRCGRTCCSGQTRITTGSRPLPRLSR